MHVIQNERKEENVRPTQFLENQHSRLYVLAFLMYIDASYYYQYRFIIIFFFVANVHFDFSRDLFFLMNFLGETLGLLLLYDCFEELRCSAMHLISIKFACRKKKPISSPDSKLSDYIAIVHSIRSMKGDRK